MSKIFNNKGEYIEVKWDKDRPPTQEERAALWLKYKGTDAVNESQVSKPSQNLLDLLRQSIDPVKKTFETTGKLLTGDIETLASMDTPFLQAVGEGGANFFKGVGNSALAGLTAPSAILPKEYNPIDAITNAINKKAGTVLPESPKIPTFGKPVEEMADVAASYPTTRYGSLDKTIETIKTDPWGVSMDALGLVGGVRTLFKPKSIKVAPEASRIMQEQVNLIREAGISKEAIAKITTEKGGQLRQITKEYIKNKPADTTVENIPKIEAIAKIKELYTPPEGKNIPEGYAESSLPKTLQESNLSPELRRRIADEPSTIYKKQTWAEAKAKADTILKEGTEKAFEVAKSKFDDVSVFIQGELMKSLDASGNTGKALDIANNLTKQSIESGRGESALRTFKPETMFAIEKLISDRLDLLSKQDPVTYERIGKAKGIEFSEKGAEIRKMPETNKKEINAKILATNRLIVEVQRIVPDPLVKQVLNAYKAGLLQLLSTHATNLGSNIIKTTLDTASKYPAALIDTIGSGLTGAERTVTMPYIGELLKASGEAIPEAWETLRTGHKPGEVINPNQVVSMSHNKVGQALQVVADYTYNVLKTEDMISLKGNMATGLKEQAKVATINLGKSNRSTLNKSINELRKSYKGEELKTKISELKQKYQTPFKETMNEFLKNPTDRMILRATKAALESVFQNETMVNNILRAISQETGMLSDFVIPFKKTPASVMSEVVNYTPASIAAEAFRQYKAKPGAEVSMGVIKDKFSFSRNMGKATVGTAIGVAVGTTIAKALSGPYAKNPKDKALNVLENIMANSVRIGNKQIPTRIFGVAGSLADIVGRGVQKYKETKDMGEAVTASLFGIPQAIIDSPMGTGLNDVQKAMQDTEGQGLRKLINMSLSTIGPVVPALTRGSDPYKRYTKDKGLSQFSTAFKAKVNPQSLPILYDVLGDPVMQEKGGVYKQIFDFTKSSTLRNQDNPVVKEFRRLSDAGNNPTPTPIDLKEKIAGIEIELKPENVSKLQKYVGKTTQKSLSNFMDSATYKILNDKEKAQKIAKTYDDLKDIFLIVYGAQTKSVGSGALSVAVKNLNAEQKNYLRTGTYKPIIDDSEKELSRVLKSIAMSRVLEEIKKIK